MSNGILICHCSGEVKSIGENIYLRIIQVVPAHGPRPYRMLSVLDANGDTMFTKGYPDVFPAVVVELDALVPSLSKKLLNLFQIVF